MPIKYQVDGNILREISEKWPFAYVKECLIRVREYRTDVAGNKLEYFQLSDGRIFTRTIVGLHAASKLVSGSRAHLGPSHLATSGVSDQSITRPR